MECYRFDLLTSLSGEGAAVTRVSSASFSPDETKIVSTTHSDAYKRKVSLWNADQGSYITSYSTGYDHLTKVIGASFSPDGTKNR